MADSELDIMKINIFKILILTAFTIGVSSCAKEVMSPLSYKKSVMIVGSGGGFTGAMSQYYLLDNGQVFRSGNTDTTFTEIGKLTSALTDQLFTTYNILNFGQTKLDEPGNKYFFIIKKENSVATKMQWGYKELANKSPEIFHKNFMNIIKELELVKAKN